MQNNEGAKSDSINQGSAPYEAGARETNADRRMENRVFEWTKVLGPLVISWPLVALVIVIVFKAPLLRLFDRFAETEGSKAEIGPIKIELGRAAVIPPQYRSAERQGEPERLDLSMRIGEIRDTGAEGTTVGFALAYALQAEIQSKTGQRVVVSPRGIYVLAKRYDDWPGEAYEGTSIEGGLKALQAVGAYLESDWPYAQKNAPKAGAKLVYKLSGYRKLEGVEQILNALREGHVVAATIRATTDFDTPKTDGTVTIKLPLKDLGQKAIVLVGYDSKTAFFTFANDWGKEWGRSGFGSIKDTDFTRILDSAYALDL